MWQIICLCLPALTMLDQPRFYTLLHAAIQASAQEQGPVDLSLCFLPSLTIEEALTVLEERRDLVRRALIPFARHRDNTEPMWREVQLLMQDHVQAMLEAELAWLDRALHRLSGLENVRAALVQSEREENHEHTRDF